MTRWRKVEPRRSLVLALAALGLGCSSTEPPLTVAWPEASLPVAFLFEHFEDQIQLVAGPIRVPSDPVLWPEREGAALLLVGLSEATLLELHPRADVGAKVDAFRLSAEAESCDRGRVLDDHRRVFALPQASIVLEPLFGTLDAAEIEAVRETLGQWSLELPLGRSGCARTPPRASPFSAELQFLAPGLMIDGRARFPSDPVDYDLFFETHTADWISEDAVAVSSDFNLFWVERGRPAEDTLDRRLEYASVLPETDPMGGWICRSLHRLPNRPGRLLAGFVGFNPSMSALLEIDTSRGRFEVVSSSVSAGRGVRSIAVDADDRILVGSGEGRVGHGSVGAGLEGWTPLPGEATNVDLAVSLESETPAFLVGTSGGSVYRVPWPSTGEARRVSLPGDPTSISSLSRLDRSEVDAYMLHRPTSEPSLSVGGEDWSLEPLELPDAARGCSGEADACGARKLADIVSLSGQLDERAFVFAPRRCTAMFRYEPDGRCIDVIPLPGTENIGNDPALKWWDTRRLGDRVIVIGEPARLIELTP